MNPFNRTFEQTFPCGTSIRPCKNRFGNGITPVTFTNFVNNTDIPFFLTKYKSIYNTITGCRMSPENVNYYQEIELPCLKYTPYFVNDYDKYRSNKLITNKHYSIVN